MNQDYHYISKIITDWYILNRRDLPWRHTKDPYKIWISEIILQQTRVVQGYEYYINFLNTFPDIASLANAGEDQVLKLWQGLGYYSRARNLHSAAKNIMYAHKGFFPGNYSEILALKGIGEYTAAAISSFAFDLPYAAVDGNVFRVISRLFAIETPIDTNEGKKLFAETAGKLLNKENPGLHNQAIMEFGALQCTPASPDCAGCVLSNICMAYIKNNVAHYPVKQNKTKVSERYFNYLDIHCGSFIYLNKRINNDIWKNLYELPLIETPQKYSFEDLQNSEVFKSIFDAAGDIIINPIPISLKHVLSHRIIYAFFYKIEISDDTNLKNKYIKTSADSISGYAVSRLVDKYLKLSKDSNLFL